MRLINAQRVGSFHRMLIYSDLTNKTAGMTAHGGCSSNSCFYLDYFLKLFNTSHSCTGLGSQEMMCSLTTGHISTRSHKIERLFEVFHFPTLVPGKRAERDPRSNINACGFPLPFPSIPYFLFLVRHHLLQGKEICMCTPGAQ